MNTAQFATYVRLAALPEGEYGFIHPSFGHLDLAYPEVRVGLRVVATPSSEPVDQGGWIVIECRPDPSNIKRGLQIIGETYQSRSAEPTDSGTEVAIPILSDAEALNNLPEAVIFDIEPESPAVVDFQAQTTTEPSHNELKVSTNLADLLSNQSTPEDLESIIVHYLGIHLLQTLRHASADVLTWWPVGSQEADLKAAIARVHRLLTR